MTFIEHFGYVGKTGANFLLLTWILLVSLKYFLLLRVPAGVNHSTRIGSKGIQRCEKHLSH